MTLRIYPQPTLFDSDVALIRAATPIPVSSFFLRRPYFVPWTALTSVFILETDEPDAVHEITINRTDKTAVVPGQGFLTLSLQLLKGANRIDVKTPNQNIYITVAATAVESWISTLGREYYLSVGRRLGDIQNHFATPWTTRASAYLLPFTDLFLPARMPKIQQTRLATLTSMGGRLGSGDGVRTMASAVSYSTPPVGKPYAAEFAMPGADYNYPHVTTHPTTGEAQGRLLDLWYANNCLATHQALFQFSLALGGPDVPEPKPIRLVAIDDRQVLLQYMMGPTEVHYIDPSSPECSDIEFNTACDAASRAFLSFEATIDVMMNTPQLPFDEVVEAPLNFGFWDEGAALDGSEGSGEPGLGGGDDAHDTVDAGDPFGTGFSMFSLSRRFDNLGCLDTRMQRGQRMVKFVFPITSSSPPALTPEPDVMVEGAPLKLDAGTGAPNPIIGAVTLWMSSFKNFLNNGDFIRFENPDVEYSVVSSWPVFDAAKIIKSDVTTTYTPSGTQKILTAPTGFFEPRHEGMGLRTSKQLYNGLTASVTATNGSATVTGVSTTFLVDLVPGSVVLIGIDPTPYTVLLVGTNLSLTLTVPYAGATQTATALSLAPGLWSIVETSDDGINSYATIAGNPTAPPGGPLIVNVYEPLRDRSDTSEPVDSLLQDSAGRRTYEIVLSSGLLANLSDGTLASYRDAPRAAGGFLIGVSTFNMASDVLPLAGDHLYFTSATSRHINSIIDTGLVQHTTGWKIYTIQIDGLTPAAFADNVPLYVVRADPCWPNGDPVTPLMLITLAPPAYITP